MKDKKVLIVDDTPTNLPVLTRLLGVIGFSPANISCTENPFEAIDMLKKQPVDLVITDYEMPRINGLDLLKEIKNDPSLYKIPVILNSGTATPELVRQATLFGAIGFFPKPYDIKEIEDVVRKIFPV